jgi:putative membrane protein
VAKILAVADETFLRDDPMKQTLTDQERTHLDQRIADAEKRTGAQIVLAVIERSDSYAELPWKAFALGAAIAGPSLVLFDLMTPGWSSGLAILSAVVAMLATGAAFALLCIIVPAFARLFLDTNRADVEARQYAQSFFLSRELFNTRGRTSVLLLVSMFEREVVIFPDIGLKDRLSQEAMNGIIAQMAPALAMGQTSRALEQGLDGLAEVLASTSTGATRENELPNRIIEEKGA